MPSVSISPQHFGRPIGLSVGRMEPQRNWGCREQPCCPECSGLEFPIYPERRSGRSIERFVRVMGGLSSRLKDESSAGLRVMEAVAS